MNTKTISFRNSIQVVFNDFHYLFLVAFLFIFVIDLTVMPIQNFWSDVKFSSFLSVFIAGLISVLLYYKPKTSTPKTVEVDPTLNFIAQEYLMEPWVCYSYTFIVTFTIMALQIPSWDLLGNLGYCIAVAGFVSGLLAFVILIIKKVRYGKRTV